MANREDNLEQWAEARLASLEPPAAWQPNANRAFAGIERFDRKMRSRRVRRLVAVGAFAAVCVAALLLEAPKAYCAGNACGNAQNTAVPVAPRQMAVSDFKESGAPDARVTVEIYFDYQCTPCKTTFENMIPKLTAEYVQTGKVRLLYRDFPLPIHRYAKLAARYADAAGLAGAYEAAATEIFRTQAAWTATGDVDAQLAAVLPADTMQKIRTLVNEVGPDQAIAADIAMGQQDQIVSTPTLVIVKDGTREKIPLHLSYELLKSLLDSMLAR